MIAWIETSDVKVPGTIEILEACGSLIYCSLTETSSISINFKIRCILCYAYRTHVFTIVYVNTFHETKGDFPVLVLCCRLKYETIIL